MLAAICDRRGIAVGGEVASRGSASSPALARRAGRRVRVGCPVIRGPLPQQEQLTSMTGPCGWHTTQCRASVTRSPSRCSQTMARSSRCCSASCLVGGSRPQVGQARGARAAAGRVRAQAAGKLMRAWIGCGGVASGSAGAAARGHHPGPLIHLPGGVAACVGCSHRCDVAGALVRGAVGNVRR